MQNVFTRFVAKDTGSFNAHFRHSRLVLTGMYVALLAVVLFSSAAVTRTLFSRRLDVRFSAFEKSLVDPRGRPPSADDVREDLQHVVTLVNGLLVIVVGGLSYILAGATLRPMRDAYERERRFLSDASHELRTPLTILQTDLTHDLAHAATPDTRARTESHLEEVQRMTRLVRDLLTVSRLENDTPTAPATITVDLAVVTRDAVARLRSVANAQGITIALADTLPAHAPVRAPHADVVMEALTNVMHNAVLYNTPGGRVDVALHETNDVFTVRITDTGIGIPEEDVPHVFDRFYRSEKSRSRQTGGSGLGLSIVQSIMRSIGGHASVTSTVGKGTTVTLVFPIHKAS